MKNRFYVYAHYRATDGSLFYIGKGCGNRAKSKSGRSEHWRRIVKKNGYFIGYLGFFDNEDDCYNFEIEQIFKARMVAKICNVANGGDGGLKGTKLCEEHKEKLRIAKKGKRQMPEHAAKSASAKKGKRQPKSAVDYVSSLKRIPLISSDGRIFESASDAARVLSKEMNKHISQGNISSCARGERNNAYGLTWSYDLSSTPKFKKTKYRSKKIICSNGMIFSSVQEAKEWVSSFRGVAHNQPISKAARDGNKAYGFNWRYEDESAKVA